MQIFSRVFLVPKDSITDWHGNNNTACVLSLFVVCFSMRFLWNNACVLSLFFFLLFCLKCDQIFMLFLCLFVEIFIKFLLPVTKKASLSLFMLWKRKKTKIKKKLVIIFVDFLVLHSLGFSIQFTLFRWIVCF